ncbi:MAG: prolyl oligopeptidase family serine peptidase [Flavobacteriales bacterium]|nr:prolyl oligopeptidase family serine peptidase [Flavobacteriales bacterium]
MKKICNLKIVTLVAWMMLGTVLGNSQEKPVQKDADLIKAENEKFGPRLDPLKYFNLELVSHCQLSPDGSKLAYVVSKGEEFKLYKKNVTDGEPVLITEFSSISKVELRWLNDSFLAFKSTERNQSRANIFFLNIENPKRIIPLAKPGQMVDWVNGIKPHPEHFYFALDNNLDNSPDLMIYQLKTDQAVMKIENPGYVFQWIINNKGELAGVMTCEDGRRKLHKEITKKNFEGGLSIEIQIMDDLRPIGVTADDQRLICLSNLNRENMALVEVDLASMTEKTVLYTAANMDVLDCYFSNVLGKPICAFYGPGQPNTEILDDQCKKAFTAAKQKLNKEDHVEIVSANASGSIVVFKVSSPKFPTEFYVYNAQSNKLDAIHRPVLRESVEKTIVNREIDIKSRNGYLLKGYISSPPSSQTVIGLVVLVGDLPFERVSLEYNPIVNYLCAHGLMVLQVDHVGVSGYGKKFKASGYGELDGKMIDDFVDAVQACKSQQLYNGRKVGIVGRGYGGHAALLCMLKYSDVFSVYACESGIMTISNYAEHMVKGTQECKNIINRYYSNDAIPSNGDLFSAFLALDLENGLDERLLMGITSEFEMFDSEEALNIATICEQKNVGVNVLEMGISTTQDKKKVTQMDYYKKMIDVLKLGLLTSRSEK